MKRPFYPPTDQIEEQGITLTQSKLPKHWINKCEGGKLPGLDGLIRIYDSKYMDTGLIFDYQLKTSTKAGINFYDLKREVYNLALCKTIPLIVIFVNLSDGIVYWEYIDGYYVYSRLKNKLNKTNRINFLRKIDSPNFESEIIEICKKHVPSINDSDIDDLEVQKKLEEKFLREGQEISTKQKFGTGLSKSKDINSGVIKIKKYIEELEGKCYLYLLTIYLIEPYNKLRTEVNFARLRITKAEQEVFLRKLIKNKMLVEEGEYIYINKREEVKSAIREQVNEADLNKVLEIV